MLINISHHNPVPLYQQIVEQLKGKIIRGDLKPGDGLPSIRQLAEELTISVITTKRAYQELEREGLIRTRPGLGTFVAEVSSQEVKEIRLRQVRERLAEVFREAEAAGLTTTELRQLIEELLSTKGEC